MDIITHRSICQDLCGKPIHMTKGHCRVQMSPIQTMVADHSGLIHGGFIFGLADYAAMLAVNHSNVVLGFAEVKFLKPVRLGEILIADASVEEIKGKKHSVSVSVSRNQELIFEGMFVCFTPDRHVLSEK